MTATPATCPVCGTVSDPGSIRCVACGSGLGRTAPPPTVGTVPVVTRHRPVVDAQSSPPTPASGGRSSEGPPTPRRDPTTRALIVAVAIAVVLLGAVVALVLTRSSSNTGVDVTSGRPGGSEMESVDQRQDERRGGQDERGRSETTVVDLSQPDDDDHGHDHDETANGDSARPPAALLRPSRIAASCQSGPGVDAGNNQTHYPPEMAIDGDASTTWRCDGDAIGHTLTMWFDEPVAVAEVGIVAGFDKVDPYDGADRWFQNRRVSRVDYVFDDGEIPVNLTDTRGLQFTSVATATQATTAVTVRIEATVSGRPVRNHAGELLDANDKTPISELQVRGWIVGG